MNLKYYYRLKDDCSVVPLVRYSVALIENVQVGHFQGPFVFSSSVCSENLLSVVRLPMGSSRDCFDEVSYGCPDACSTFTCVVEPVRTRITY